MKKGETGESFGWVDNQENRPFKPQVDYTVIERILQVTDKKQKNDNLHLLQWTSYMKRKGSGLRS